jgi:hypothetical protein
MSVKLFRIIIIRGYFCVGGRSPLRPSLTRYFAKSCKIICAVLANRQAIANYAAFANFRAGSWSTPLGMTKKRRGGVAGAGAPAEGVDANPRTARGCGGGGHFPHPAKHHFKND